MCEWGTWERLQLKIPTDVDKCIAPLVLALHEFGIETIASCCGHGKATGNVALSDGRMLDIFPNYMAWFKHAQTHGHCNGRGKA